MKEILRLLDKYWVTLSLIFTLISSIITGGWYLKGKIDIATDTLFDTKVTVKENSKAISELQEEVLKLKEDERLREAGLCK